MLKLSNHLLRWYEDNGRVLPWRVSPAEFKRGVKPDPYRVWVSEIMLQQTTVGTVIPYFNKFMERWINLEILSLESQSEITSFWAGLGYYSRARNLLKCAKEVMQSYQGIIPEEKNQLKSLPGIGEYTASAIRSIAFQKFDIVIDGNIERVIVRLFKIETPIKFSRKLIYEKANQIFPKKQSGDFCQGLMDLANLICKPKKPECPKCPISKFCFTCKDGMTEKIPVKIPKKVKTQKRGFVFFIQNKEGQFLLERRPDNGLLGGLLAFPTSEWEEITPKLQYPVNAEWKKSVSIIKHEFSHFKLELNLVIGTTESITSFGSGYKIFNLANFQESVLPTLMRKVLKEIQKKQ